MNPRYWIILFLTFCLVACQGRATPTLYVPPTREATSAPQLSGNSTEAPPRTQIVLSTPSPVCSPGLTFLEDITIPDGTSVSPGELLDKRWLVENTGSCNWDGDYSLVLIAGAELGATSEKALVPARSGNQAEIRVLFNAPNEPGAYRSAWQAQDSQGNLFGDPIFIEIVVRNQ